jgi:hypothetical protein
LKSLMTDRLFPRQSACHAAGKASVIKNRCAHPTGGRERSWAYATRTTSQIGRRTSFGSGYFRRWTAQSARQTSQALKIRCRPVWLFGVPVADLGLALMSGPFPPPRSVEEAALPSSPDRMPPNGRGIPEVSRGRPTSRPQINRTPLVPVGPVASFSHRRRRAGARLCLF